MYLTIKSKKGHLRRLVGFPLYHKPLELLNPGVRWVLNLIVIFLVQIELVLTIFKGVIKMCTFFGFGLTWLKS